MKTLNTKITITKNDTKIVDLVEPTFIPDYDSQYFIVYKVVQVTEEYDRRPDLLSFALYGNDTYTDIILKCNEISDPFSIRTGDVLVVPDLNGAKKFYITPKEEKEEQEKNPFIDPSKKSEPDENRLQTLAKISASIKNGSTNNLKPNQLQPGESNIIIDEDTNSLQV